MANEEGALRNQRIEWVRETTEGVVPTNPSFSYYSDTVTGFTWSPTAGLDERRGLGDPDPKTFLNGPEGHEITVTYDMQTFPVDTYGDPNAADGDGVVRGTDNGLPNTHTVSARETNDAIPAGETVDGWGDTGQESGSATSKDTRLYVVGKGGSIGTVTYTGDPGSDQPVVVEVTYTFEKVREYQIDQPDGDTLTVQSTDAADTSQTLTVEDDAGTSEDVSLNGTNGVNTSKTDWNSIDALALDAEAQGDVVVTDGTEVLAIIRGSDHYGHGEGDLGVPDVGTGSHASALNTSYETILGDDIERPDGTALAYEINSVEFTVENNLETREQVGTPRMAISAGDRESTVTATIVGPSESVQAADVHLGNQGSNVRWTMTGGYLELTDARLTDFSGVDKSQGDASMSLDNTFTGEGLTAST